MFERYLNSNVIPFETASSASTLDELHEDITRSCNPLGIWLPRQPMTAAASYKLVKFTGLNIGWSKGFDNTRFHLRPRPSIRQFIPLGGTAELRFRGGRYDNSVGRSAIIPANQDHSMAYGAGFRSVILNFDETILLRKFRAIVGSEEAAPSFSRPIQMNHPRVRAMMRAIQYAFQEMEAGGKIISKTLVDELSQLIIVSFLLASETSLLDLEDNERSVTSSQLKLVTDYIEANWRDSLDIEKLASLTGTSVRTVFREFKRQYGETPAQFLRGIRLSHAKRMLSEGKSNDSVIGISLLCGFASAGHFARHYQNRFGEKPYETLRSSSKREAD